MCKTLSALTLLASALLAPTVAQADTFTLTTVPGGSAPYPFTLTFTLPASPTVSSVNPNYFTVSTSVVRNGVTDPTDKVFFFTPLLGGGFSDLDNPFASGTYGPQLFSGTIANPTFLIGTFNLSNESPGGPTDSILTITAGTTPTPEPSSLILLGTAALGLAGAASRRLRK